MTVSRRILLHVAVGAALVITVVSAVNYRLVSEAAEVRAMENLRTYVAERTRREEAGFRFVSSNLEVVRGQFLKRDRQPLLNDLPTRWNDRFECYPDGAWRNHESFYNPKVYSNLWARKGVDLTPQFQTRVLRAQELCEELQPAWLESFPSLYFIFPGPATMGFCPNIPRWCWQTPGDFDLDAEEWVQAALPQNNPARGLVWTGVFVDEMTHEPFVTVLLPVDEDGQHVATVAHDMHINQLFNEIARSEFNGATHVIFRPDGRLVAHPTLRDQILASNGRLKAQDSGDPALANLYRQIVARAEPQVSGFEPIGASYYSASRLPGAQWYFVTLMPQAVVRMQAVHSAQWVWISGLTSLALLSVSFAGILRRQVTRPLAALTSAAKAMTAGARELPAPVKRDDELGELAESFHEMVGEVAARETELRQLNLSLEKRVDERTDDLHRALDRERELSELKTNFVSLVSHEFRTPLGIIGSSAQILDRYFSRLDEAGRREHLDNIDVSVKRMAGIMENMLLLSRVDGARMEYQPVPLALGDFCRRLLDEMHSAHRGTIELHVDPAAETPAESDENLLRHILTNLLTNALKYSPAGQPVRLTLQRDGREAVFTVQDRGIGIPEADHPNLFSAFFRATNVGQVSGTGLGLVIVRRCCELHGGTVCFESRPGEGTKFIVRLPVFPSIALCS